MTEYILSWRVMIVFIINVDPLYHENKKVRSTCQIAVSCTDVLHICVYVHWDQLICDLTVGASSYVVSDIIIVSICTIQ